MKKLLVLAGIAATCAASAADTIVGTTEVGMLKIDSMATDCIVAVPYLELTGGDVCVSNIVKTANLAVGDELYVHDGGWTAWVLTEATGGARYWQSVGTASVDKDGNVSHGASAMPSEKKLVPGSAIWLKRANPTGPFYVYGGYRASLTTPVTAGAFNLIANPLDVATEIPGKETGDQVMVVNSATSTLRYRYSEKNGGWASQLADGTWSTPGELKIPVGQGVWYAPKTSRTITWR